MWAFSERITFYPSGAEVKGSGTTAYAWFVWEKDGPSGTELKWLQPGYKARMDVPCRFSSAAEIRAAPDTVEKLPTVVAGDSATHRLLHLTGLHPTTNALA